MALLQKLAGDKGMSVSTGASEAYYATLQKYHGFIVTTTFTVALKLVPSRSVGWVQWLVASEACPAGQAG